MEESISGFKTRGDWGDVVEHGERITRALRESGVTDEQFADAFTEWEEWRPKAHERLGDDVEQKTAEQASVDEGEGEKAGKEPSEDLRTASEKLSESYEQVEAGDNESALERWQDSIDHVVRAADSAGRRAVRSVEDTVYRRVMTQLAPYYFDNELVSANIQKTTRGNGNGEGPAFVFEVNVNDDQLKDAVSDRLSEYEDEVDRWHVDTPKEVEAVEAAEGVEPPVETVDNDDGTDGRSKSTTN
jgi:hypothetical protein